MRVRSTELVSVGATTGSYEVVPVQAEGEEQRAKGKKMDGQNNRTER